MTRQPSRGLRRATYRILAALLLFCLPAGITAAQSPALTIEQASLRLWPEYDDPGLLVIFNGSFTDAAAFPQQVAFPIAAGARNIQATYRDASGNLLMREYTVTDDRLTYELPLPAFHYEYYVDRPPSGDQREIVFSFDPGYTTKTLEVIVQEPARAGGFGVTPAEQSQYKGDDGLTYHVLNLVDITPGQPVEIAIRYTKSDSGLSKPQLAVTNAGTDASAVTATNGTRQSWLPYAMLGLGLALLLAAVAYWYFVQRHARPVQTVRSEPTTGGKRAGASGRTTLPTAARGASRPTVRAAAPGAQAVYCTQCGHTLQPDDRFCAQCGAPRR